LHSLISSSADHLSIPFQMSFLVSCQLHGLHPQYLRITNIQGNLLSSFIQITVTILDSIVYLVYKPVVNTILALFWKSTKTDIFFWCWQQHILSSSNVPKPLSPPSSLLKYVTSMTYIDAAYKLKLKVIPTLSFIFLDNT